MAHAVANVTIDPLSNRVYFVSSDSGVLLLNCYIITSSSIRQLFSVNISNATKLQNASTVSFTVNMEHQRVYVLAPSTSADEFSIVTFDGITGVILHTTPQATCKFFVSDIWFDPTWKQIRMVGVNPSLYETVAASVDPFTGACVKSSIVGTSVVPISAYCSNLQMIYMWMYTPTTSSSWSERAQPRVVNRRVDRGGFSTTTSTFTWTSSLGGNTFFTFDFESNQFSNHLPVTSLPNALVCN
jgi:hypothetical protein